MNYLIEADRDATICAAIGIEAIGEENMTEVLDWLSDMIRLHEPPAEIYIAEMKATNKEGDLESFSIMDSPYNGV